LAIPLLVETVSMLQESLPPDHPLTMYAVYNLAELRLGQHQAVESAKWRATAETEP
jgi:hypothetical protein